jgi:hypothetical protein
MVEVFIIAWVVAEMDEAVYKYDYETQDWILSEDEWFNNADIEDIPFVFELNCDPMADDYNEAVLLKSAWDTAKRQYIPYSELKQYDYKKIGYLYMDVKEDYPFNSYNIEDVYEYIVRYRLKLDKLKKTIHVFADKIVVKFLNSKNNYKPKIVKSFVMYWCINYGEMKEYSYPNTNSKMWNSITLTNYRYNNIPLNSQVVYCIIDMIKTIIESQFGYRPSTLAIKDSKAELYAFMDRPLDYRIGLLHNFIGPKFKKIFPYNEPDNFSLLCKYLEIKPTKGLRKAYTFNYTAVIMHKIAIYLGFKDYNAIRKFYNIDTIVNIKVNDIRYTETWFEENLSNLRNYVQLCIRKKGEMWTVKRVFSIPSNYYANDILKMCSECEKYLDDDAVNPLLTWEFDKELHDYLVEIVNEIMGDTDDFIIEYSPEELALECIINEYEFSLIHLTRDFYRIGKALNNCVAGYKKDVKNGWCRIVTISKDKHYVAAIELDKDKIIKQALSTSNKPLIRDVRKVFGKWMSLNKLTITPNSWGDNYEWLSEIDLSDEEFVIKKRPYKKYLAEMNLQELLDLEADKIIPRYYRILGKRLLDDKEFPKIIAPPWKKFKNEKDYLKYHFPEGVRIYEAAYEGIPEAQKTLSDMYTYGSHIPLNIKNGMYWLGLSEGYNSIIMRYIVDGDKSVGEKSQLYMTLVMKLSSISKEYGIAAFQKYKDKIIVAEH